MISAADLDALLTRLRAAGPRVGVEDALRASYLVEQLHQTDSAAWLREVLLAILVKSPAHSEPFEEIFTAWALELSEREHPHEEPPALDTPGLPVQTARPLSAPPKKRALWSRMLVRWRRIAALLGVLGVVSFLVLWSVRWLISSPPPPPIGDAGAAGLPPPPG